MKRLTAHLLLVAFTLSMSASCLADFQYTETSKITGGAMIGTMKMLGAFSKDARNATKPQNSTISVKGNKMRRESGEGTAEIWDLDGRRIIHIDAKHQTYSIVTFDQMRAQMEEARKKAAEQRAAKGKGQDPQVKMTPKISITPGTQTKQILNRTAKEVRMRIDIEMESTDPKTKGQGGNMWTTSDQWRAPVTGYDELTRFNLRMAKEFEWLPSEIMGGSAQMAPAMAELRKNSVKMEGMPLLQNTSVGMTGNAQNPQAQQSDQGGNPLTKGFGGLLGRKKKNKDDDAQSNGGSSSAGNGSLMDMTVEVTSISTSKLDPALFEIPAGYKQVDAKERGR